MSFPLLRIKYNIKVNENEMCADGMSLFKFLHFLFEDEVLAFIMPE